MMIICHNCGKKGYKKKEYWLRSGVAGSDSGKRGNRGMRQTTSRRGNTCNGMGNGNQFASAIWSFKEGTDRNDITVSSQPEFDKTWWVNSCSLTHIWGIRFNFTGPTL